MEHYEVRIITQDGTVHRGFKSGALLFSVESCNADDMKARDVVPLNEAFKERDHSRYCERCFPLVER